MKKIFIGTAGWSYKDWVGSFYSKSQSENYDWLKFYSQFFNTVEVNSTYYSYINPAVVKGWIEKISDKEDFIFEIKLHGDFTHKRRIDKTGIRAVCENLDMLKDSGRLGNLLIQFPYSFQMNEPNCRYISNLAGLFDSYKKVVEVRHNSWNNDNALNLFKENDLTFCSVDQPEIGRSLTFDITIINKKAYLRLHGRNKDEWFKSINNFNDNQTYEEKNSRYDYRYSTGELTEIQMMIEEHFSEIEEIHIIFNNHPGGKAALNAAELNKLLGIDVPDIPPTNKQNSQLNLAF